MKATSNEMFSPKQKHLDTLLQRINMKEANLDEVSNPLVERLQSNSWITCYKAIITLHYLIQKGNERFLQNISAKNPDFLNIRKFPYSEHTAIRFLQNHSNFLESKLQIYNSAGFDYCRVRRGQFGFLRTIKSSRVFEHLMHLRQLIQDIVLFNPKENDLRSGLVLTSFSRIFKDLTELYQFLNEGVMILIEVFFDLEHVKAKQAFEFYKYCLSVNDVIKGIFAEAQEVGIEFSDFNSYSKCRTDMVATMDVHIKSMQTNKSPENNKVPSLPKPIGSPAKNAYKQPLPGAYRKQQSVPEMRIADNSSPESFESLSPPPEKNRGPVKGLSYGLLFPVQFETATETKSDASDLIKLPLKDAPKSSPSSPNMSVRAKPNLKQKSVPDLMVKYGLHQDLLELQDFYSGRGNAVASKKANKNYSKQEVNPFGNFEQG